VIKRLILIVIDGAGGHFTGADWCSARGVHAMLPNDKRRGMLGIPKHCALGMEKRIL
jgi:hypothetical protein